MVGFEYKTSKYVYVNNTYTIFTCRLIRIEPSTTEMTIC